MEVTFWGVRGSIPVPGRSTLRYGGNTSCVEVRDGELQIILDAGSGLRGLGMSLTARTKAPIQTHIFITHTHWDHIQGFPFFGPAYVPGNEIVIYGMGVQSTLEAAMRYQMDGGTFFPVEMNALGANLRFVDLAVPEKLTLGADISVSSIMLTHPGFSVGYRVESPRGKMAYITDWEPLARNCATTPSGPCHEDPTARRSAGRLDEDVIHFCEGVELGVFDSQYDCDEYPTRLGWGHACIDDVIDVGLEARVRELALFHHDPTHDDARIDCMVRHCRDRVRAARRRMKVFGAREGKTVVL